MNNDFLCDSLKGRVSIDLDDKVFLTVDGEKILYGEFEKENFENFAKLNPNELRKNLEEVSSLNIENAINSQDPVKVAYALLDKRLSLKDLKKLKDKFENKEGILPFLYNLRYQAEGFYF